MNITKHPIYKQIYELCLEIEELPASLQQTKVVTMASAMEKPADELLAYLAEIKATALNCTDGRLGLAHIIRLCIDAGIPSQGRESNPKPFATQKRPNDA
jgi:hypothetical protein